MERNTHPGEPDKKIDQGDSLLQCETSVIEHPYTNLNDGQWLRGNLHTHSTLSDGNHPPQTVIEQYAKAGYDFLMMSDHDLYTSETHYADLNNFGIALIPGNEISRNGPHILHVDADKHVHCHEDRQLVIDEINQGRGFSIVPHPNWKEDFNHCPHERLEKWQGYTGLEIYNGVVTRLNGSPYATDRWDRLLASGRRLWGYAHDDFHDLTNGDFARGWNVAYANHRSPESIVRALRTGKFYASTGVIISCLHVNGNRIHIETENAERIVALADTARRIAVADGSSMEVEMANGIRYLRLECWGRGEQFAWTQPFWRKE